MQNTTLFPKLINNKISVKKISSNTKWAICAPINQDNKISLKFPHSFREKVDAYQTKLTILYKHGEKEWRKIYRFLI